MGFSGKNTVGGSHFLLQWIFLTSNQTLSLKSPELAGGFLTASTTREAMFPLIGFYQLLQLLKGHQRPSQP